MKISFDSIDWLGLVKAILKAAIPFVSGGLGGFLAGCSVMGSGVGVTI